MKIIQSFWSKPFLEKNTDKNARFKAGWTSTNLFFYSTLLSCLTLKRQYGSVTMYTDYYGKKLFEDLQIPYSSIQTDLETLNQYPSELWALGKIRSYSLQNEPFLHIDTDVFIWDRFPQQFVAADLCFQNLEFNFPKYKEVVDKIIENFKGIPHVLIDEYTKNGNIHALNAGVIGGNHTQFFKDLAYIIFPFIDANLGQLNTIDKGIFNMVYEQMLSMNLAKEKQLKTTPLFSSMNASFSNVMKFQLVPTQSFYIHTVGDAKKSLHVGEQVHCRFRYEFPEAYTKLNLSLESLGLYDTEYTPIHEVRYQYLQRLYDWLKTTSWQQKIETKFIINAKCNFEEIDTDHLVLHYISPQDLKNTTIRIEDWDYFIFYFEEETSIKEAVTEAYQEESISSQFTKTELEERLFSFVMDRCMYHEILLPRFIKK